MLRGHYEVSHFPTSFKSFPQVVEDPLQSQRLKYAFESEKGLLGMSFFFVCLFFPIDNSVQILVAHNVFSIALMQQSNNVDSRRCYQCVKFLVTLAQK